MIIKTGHTVINHSIAPLLEDLHIVRNIPNQYTSIKLMTKRKKKKKKGTYLPFLYGNLSQNVIFPLYRSCI